MSHEPRQTRLLRELFASRRTAALGTLGADGAPFVSLTPFAVDRAAGHLVLHVSALAAHTGNMERSARVSLLICAAEPPDAPVHDLSRVSVEATATTPAAGTPAAESARQAYLARFPDAEPMTDLPDFRFIVLDPSSARHVSGFGSARSVGAEELRQVLTRA